MQYRIVQDARLGLWRWILLDHGRAVARSIDAFVDADSCRTALHRVFENGVEPGDERQRRPHARPPEREEAQPEAQSAEDAGQFEDVGLKKMDTREPEEGEAEPAPMPQIGR